MTFDPDSIETFDRPGLYEDGGPLARRIARREIAERAAIGKPSVFAPPFTVSPFTRRAIGRQLPAAELVR